jgi:hypothetical protein
MSAWTVELELTLYGRVRKWDSRGQTELSAVLDALRERGPSVLRLDPSWITIASWDELQHEVVVEAEIYVAISGVYLCLSLRVYPGRRIIVGDAKHHG